MQPYGDLKYHTLTNLQFLFDQVDFVEGLQF